MEQNSSAQPEANSKKKRKTFTFEEDQILIQLVQEYGYKNWEIISSKIRTRSARQCRERWKFYLCPSVNRSPWTLEEDHILFEKYNIHGPKWSIICKCFQNRTLNNVKNRWNTINRKIQKLKLNANSEEDFYFCGRLISDVSSRFHIHINEKDIESSNEKKENDPQFDPFCFFRIDNLLNQIPEPV